MAEQEPRRYVLQIDGQPLSVNQASGLHWARVARDRAVWRDAFALLARQEHQGPPLARAHVRGVLVRKRGQSPLDPDNLYSRLRGPIEGLVTGGLLASSDADHLELDARQEQGRARAVRLEVTELCDALS